MLPNWESGVQNQPIAKVAVLNSLGWSRSIGGITWALAVVAVVASALEIVMASKSLMERPLGFEPADVPVVGHHIRSGLVS